MKFKCVIEYEYPVEHKPPVKAEIVLHGDRVTTDKIVPYKERPHGEWIPFSGDSLDVRMKCSVCGSVEMPLARHNFCPNCGADMRKEGE